MVATKIKIPFERERIDIVGILEQKQHERSTNGRPVALILHGVLAHKDQIYHKKLAQKLDIDSFRFDFRSNHETPGTWSMSAFDEDLDDLMTVTEYLERQYGYVITVVVGHSRGSIVGFKYCSYVRPRVKCFVNVAGRYRMHRIHDRDAVYNAAFEKEGIYRWKARVAGQVLERIVRPEDVKAFAEYDVSYIERDFPKNIEVLTIHGDHDKVVPVADAGIYANVLSARRAGSHTLHIVEGADHNFIGHFDEVVEVITNWLITIEKGQYQADTFSDLQHKPSTTLAKI